MDYDRDRPPEMSFLHYDDHWNKTMYAGCEESVDRHVRLEKERPLIVGSIRYVIVSDPTGIVPPYASGDKSVVGYQRCQRTLLGTRVLGELKYTTCQH